MEFGYVHDRTPFTPFPITVTTTGTSLTASWNAVDGASNYAVFIGVNPRQMIPVSGKITDLSFTQNNLIQGREYYAQAIAYDDSGKAIATSALELAQVIVAGAAWTDTGFTTTYMGTQSPVVLPWIIGDSPVNYSASWLFQSAPRHLGHGYLTGFTGPSGGSSYYTNFGDAQAVITNYLSATFAVGYSSNSDYASISGTIPNNRIIGYPQDGGTLQSLFVRSNVVAPSNYANFRSQNACGSQSTYETYGWVVGGLALIEQVGGVVVRTKGGANSNPDPANFVSANSCGSDQYYYCNDSLVSVKRQEQQPLSVSFVHATGGSYKALAIGVTAVNSHTETYYSQYPLDPCVVSGSANDNQTFWTAAYNAAVSAGTIAPGLVYGTGYPKTRTDAYTLSVAPYVKQGSGEGGPATNVTLPNVLPQYDTLYGIPPGSSAIIQLTVAPGATATATPDVGSGYSAVVTPVDATHIDVTTTNNNTIVNGNTVGVTVDITYGTASSTFVFYVQDLA